jgi:uncharacterized protein (DUF1697 family)
MPEYAAFLRAINVAGRRATSDQLRSCLEAEGFDDVATFRASGNVVLSARAGGVDEIARRIEAALVGALGYEVPVFLRTKAQMRAIAAHEPFPARALKASTGKLQVLLLTRAPAAAARRKALALATDEDRLAIRGAELYWLPSGGLMDSTLDRNALERIVGTSTTRTKGTIDLIAAKHFAN